MNNLFLEDCSGMTESQIKSLLVNQFSGYKCRGEYSTGPFSEVDAIKAFLEDHTVLIAYVSVGMYGCDSGAYFLLQNTTTGQFQEISGSHCSCYGFEGQFDPQDATVEFLKSPKFYLPYGGYDDNVEENKEAVREFIATIPNTQ
jgi:hypothetical protein